MKNPCKNLLDDLFDSFGYNTELGCEICGKKPAKIEPRFNYISCQLHSDLNPIRFQELVKINKLL